MSDMIEITQLAKSSIQLPVDWYFNPTILEAEQKLLFDNGPGYVGHAVMVPEVGDYYVPEWMHQSKVLIHHQTGIDLISNICRHRQARILEGRGNTKGIVCPLHRWTYALDGRLLGAPHFDHNPCLHLEKTPLQTWNGLLFCGKRFVAQDMAGLSVLHDFDFSNYLLDNVRIDHYNCNWKTFIEVYLEDYHVDPFHPGLGNFVSTADLTWEFGNWYSAQTVGVNNKHLKRSGTPIYEKWQQQVLAQYENELPPHGAIWLLYFPNIMLEWYPHTLVISTIIPTGIEHCMNVVEFYYPEEIVLFERKFVEAEQAAYLETAAEDEEICIRMTEGRRALYEQSVNQTGPYQMPMEAGMVHFHQYLRRELEPFLKST
ncbi:aromatic ring-hydroxylating dioxygenase subunit alpha [Nitrosomonas sp.]|uniref:aromatic ring-hydroxylating oxygenase subunit alpha n=1 Tax=Nitrosomonas sp. TaxID=42353 RepID=UPI00283BBCD6|nr:aromatic ring-hydroxylating dioxygenase subunit alpha [Nitrosomonas sp.]MDR4513757.1 aromatic ring-hydroxylating dioxygenase subunit alpha [Nitrosomonas sp.]